MFLSDRQLTIIKSRKGLSEKRINDIVQKSLEIELEDALKANTLGFMHRAFSMSALPVRKPKDRFYERKNGYVKLSMFDHHGFGLPFGKIPRFIHMFIITEAVKTQDRTILLGKSLASFMRKIGISTTGGEHGTINRIKDQTKKMITSSLKIVYDEFAKGKLGAISLDILSGGTVFWDPKSPEQDTLWESNLILTQEYFDELIKAPVPLDMRAVAILKNSCLQLDIYFWLSHRMFYLKKPTLIPWERLMLQFGVNYKRRIDFIRKFLVDLGAVQMLWPDLKLREEHDGLNLYPSKLLVPNKNFDFSKRIF